MSSLVCAFSIDELNHRCNCETKEIWKVLEVAHKGTNQVKGSKTNPLTHQYELFKIVSDETMKDMFYRFTNFVNELTSL